jgi:uncharacterized protein (DUF433 family)
MHEHVELRDGVYYIPGTRISLDSIVYAFREGASPETILGDFGGLTLPHVYGAISFYLDNREMVETYLRGRKEEWAALERQGTPPSPELQARLERARQSLRSTRL